MPRYRTIACDHCGHLLLKTDTECEVCARMTRRERNLWIAKGIQIGIVLIVAAFIYFRLKTGLLPQG
jgi:hypothetical protein